MLAVASLGALIIAAHGVAATAGGGQVWPGAAITVSDGTGGLAYRAAIARAVDAWNAADVGIRFALTSSASAEVRVVLVPGRCLQGRAGSAPDGFPASGFARVAVRACPAVLRPLLIAHELGRVLGLPVDDRGCSLMNSSGVSDGVRVALPRRCSPWSATWLPRLIDPATVDRARRLYASPAGPADVSLTVNGPPRISWRLPARSSAEWTEVVRGSNGCPTEFDLALGRLPVIYRERAFAGLHWARDTSLVPARGTYCYGVFDVSASGRATRQPGFVSFAFDEPPVAAFVAQPPLVAGQPVTFTDESSDPDGTIAHWHWDFGDPASGAADQVDTADPTLGRRVQHVYSTAGTYTVTLTVTDDGGKQATVTATVVVQ